MWQEVVCAPIVPCAVQFSCLRLLFLSFPFIPLSLSSFLPLLRCVLCWHLGVRGVASVHVDVCLHAMFSVWRGLLLRTQRRFPDSQTRQGRGGRGGRDDRQMQARKFFGYSGKTLRLGTPYKLPRGEGGCVARATGLAAPPLRGTANHWRKLSSLWPNTITEASCLCTCSCVCVCGVSACQLQRRLRLRLRHRRRDRGLCEVVKCAKVK